MGFVNRLLTMKTRQIFANKLLSVIVGLKKLNEWIASFRPHEVRLNKTNGNLNK